ncbi:MAG: DUF4332 domain-containing protein [Bacteroidota bacterium]
MLLFIDFCAIPWWLPWLLFPLGLLIGWFLRPGGGNTIGSLESEVSGLKSKIRGLEKDLSDTSTRKATLESDMAMLQGRLRDANINLDEGSTSGLGIADMTGTSVSSGVKGTIAKGKAVLGVAGAAGASALSGLGDQADKAGDQIGNLASEAKDKADQLVSDAGDTLEGAADKASEMTANAGDAIKDVVDEASELADSAADKAADLGETAKEKVGDLGAAAGSTLAGTAGAIGNLGEKTQDQATDMLGQSGDLFSETNTASDSTNVIAGSAAGAVPLFGTKGGSESTSAYGDALGHDNLQVIEGIGPKMEEVLKSAGVRNWSDLSAKSPEELRAILDEAGPDKYKIIDPTTWPKQAQLANDDNWDGLIDFQKRLDTNIDLGEGETDSKAENMLRKLGAIAPDANDLTAVDGIGPKAQELLYEGGIHSITDLANADPGRVKGLLAAGGSSFALVNPESWIDQAKSMTGLASGDTIGTTAQLQGAGNSVAPKTTGTSSPYAKLKEDNLQIVEGIGPKMNEVLNNAGIKTWKDLADTTPERLRTILDEAGGDRYRIIDPATWPGQAQLAATGKWDDLITTQKHLDTGKTGTTESASKLEKVLIRIGAIKRWKKDDLTAVEGIGPKIAGLLRSNGVNTWDELSTTSPDRLREILASGGSRFRLADPDTWPKQAALAAAGEWDKLQEYQDFLDGGR